MRIKDIITEATRRKTPVAAVAPTDEYNRGWDMLNSLKEDAQRNGARLAGSYQLFVPRGHHRAQTSRDRRLQNLANSWAWDEKDPTQLKPKYDKWEQGQKDLSPTGEIDEAAPLLAPGRTESPPGNNKPGDAKLWTSTAKKAYGGWTSEWANWVAGNQPDWFSRTGYLYKVKPGALILSLNSDLDAERIYYAFKDLGGTNEPKPSLAQLDDEYAMRSVFPWDRIVKHFDGVWHGGYRTDGFMYGWDVESTAWFDVSFLQLISEVPVVGYGDDD